MINKSKIMKAVQKGIKSGFKISSNNIIDDSSYINFDDSKVNDIRSLTIKDVFENYILNDNRIGLLTCLENAGLDYFEEYRTNKIVDSIYNAIKKLGFEYVKKHIQPISNKELKDTIKYYKKIVRTEPDLNWLDVSNIENMSKLFDSYPFNGDISEWDVSNVTNMSYMFAGTYFNKDISKWDVSNVENMYKMFYNSDFNNDISIWDVSNVENMERMFANSKFNNDISKWNVSNVENMERMFNNSYFDNDISNWNISDNCNIEDMFKDCQIKNKNKPYLLQE